MSVFRIYANKCNTIASGPFVNFNSGQNPVSNIWFGGGISSTNTYSRFLMEFDLADLQSRLASLEINPSLITSYKLRMKNAIPNDSILGENLTLKDPYNNIASSFDLICFPINKAWDEGRGYELQQGLYLTRHGNNPSTTGYSNWNFATSTNAWDAPGVYINPTASTAVTSYSSQHFDLGNEDICMDITSIVNDWLSGGSVNNGLGISYRRDIETTSAQSVYISSFYTKHTNTAFKPFIEVNYNQSFKDDRANITNNRICKLFLYTFSGNNPVNFFSCSTVNIQTHQGVNVYTGLTPTQVETGVYFVDVWMSAATRGTQFKDVWCGVTFNPGYDQQNFYQSFTVQDNFYQTSSNGINNYSISTYGLDNDSILDTEEVIRVYADLRVNYSTNSPKSNYDLQYRLVMNNQEAVIPWTSMNQAILNKCLTNYFVLQTNWLLQNQTYQVQFRISEIGTIRTLPESINFKIRRSF